MKSKSKNAFTLVELLVVISIIALLLSVLMPALSKAREQARKVVCGNGCRQLVLGLMVYSNTNGGRLPINTFNGWLWDVGDPTIVSIMTASGATRKSFYCPSNSPFTNKSLDKNARYWDLEALKQSANSSSPGYRITGYFWLMEAEWKAGNEIQSRSKVYADAKYASDQFPNYWPKTTFGKNPSATELVTDATESSNVSPKFPNGKFTNVYCGEYYSRTSHLVPGKNNVGAGGNMGFLDGHVGWRHFKDMRKRIGTSPIFWW